MVTPVELAPDYYLHNFRLLLADIAKRHADLLLCDEHAWLTRFAALSHPAACLLVRLLSRKGEWFRADKLHYPEIGALPLDELAQTGFIRLAQPDWPELGALLTRPEIQSLASHLPRSARKEALLDELANTPLPALPFVCLQVLDKALLARFLLLFFGNREQDLTEFVLLDLGHYRYESYPLDPACRLFQSRQQLDARWALDEWQAQWLVERANTGPEVAANWWPTLPARSDWPPLARRRERLQLALARDLERCGDDELALHLYADCQMPPARERQVRLWLKRGEHTQAAAMLAEMIAAPRDEEERAVLRPLQEKLARALGNRVPRHRRPEFPALDLTLSPWPGRVEEAALTALAQQDWHGGWCENALLGGIFGLLFWDALFAPLPGAFFNRYQRGPADLYSSTFAERRRPQIAAAWAQLAAPDYREQLLLRYERKQGIANDWVVWDRLPRSLLEQALGVIPRHHWQAMLTRLLFDLRSNRSGLPDLVLFRDGEYCLVEVKGPGDDLQPHQIRWLQFFAAEGIPHAVCRVRVASDD